MNRLHRALSASLYAPTLAGCSAGLGDWDWKVDVTNIAVKCTTNSSRFVYVSNGGRGQRSFVGRRGSHGRFVYVANAGAGDISVFSVDATSGALMAVAG